MVTNCDIDEASLVVRACPLPSMVALGIKAIAFQISGSIPAALSCAANFSNLSEPHSKIQTDLKK